MPQLKLKYTENISISIHSVFFILLGINTLFSTPPDGFLNRWQDLESVYHERLREIGIIGSSMIFVANGQVLGQSFYGMADLSNHREVDAQTIFHWASITKTFTAIAIMQMRDRGLLDLEDPIIKYIPELNQVYNPYGDMKDITLRHLLTHTSGFRNSTWPWGGDQKWHPYEPKDWSQLVAMFPYTEILFEPGSQHRYSNPGIILLGRVIEILSGDNYEVYMDKNIFKPLKMYKTYFDTTPYHLIPYRSNSYHLRGDTLTSNGLDFDTGITVSNGGLNAPLSDMVKYLTFLLNTKEEYYPVLKRASLEEMWEIQLPIDSEDELQLSRGLSFLILENENLQVIGHTGEQNGFISFFYIHPGSKTGAIVVFNTQVISESGISKTRELSTEIRNLFLSRIWPLFLN